MAATKKAKPNPEHQAKLARAIMAIHAGKAYLETAWGNRRVVGYSDETGWAITQPMTGDSRFDRRSFLVCLESILIEA